MEISFIIPAHNEAAHLPATLPALHEAAAALGQAYELIVVNDDSTDRTAVVAAEHGARVLDVKLRHIAAVRNAGAQIAQGRLLCFVDADTLLPPETLRAAWRAMAQGAVAGGAYVAFDEDPGRVGAFMLGLWNMIARIRRWAAGCFLFVRADVFRSVGGFSERFFAAEEIVLSERLHRFGPFTVLPMATITSARKLQTHRVRDHLSILFKTIVTMGRAVQTRDGLTIWYGQQRV